jgi:hypothetical protein
MHTSYQTRTLPDGRLYAVQINHLTPSCGNVRFVPGSIHRSRRLVIRAAVRFHQRPHV